MPLRAIEPALEQVRGGDRILRGRAAEALRERGREPLVRGLDRDVDERRSAVDEDAPSPPPACRARRGG